MQGGGAGAVLPGQRSVFLAGQAVPRLNADEVQRLLGRGPDQGVREVGDIADDAAARVLFDDRNMRTAQVDHGVAVVVKQVVGQLDSLDVAGQVVALAVEQTVGLSTDAERRLDAVKPDLVVLGDVAVIEGQRKSRMVADAEAELVLDGVLDGQRVVDGLPFQRKRSSAAQSA